MSRRTTPREHGTRARYCFGPHGNNRGNGCRCEPCTDANRTYARFEQKRTRLQRTTGFWAVPMVDATRARQHLLTLRAAGVGYRQAAKLGALNVSVVSDIVAGRHRRIRRETEQTILAVGVDVADGAFVDAAPTWRLIDRLVAHGVTKRRIGQTVTGNPDTLALQLRRDGKITARAARRVEHLHRELLGDPAWYDMPVVADRRRFPTAPALAAIDQAGIPRLRVREAGVNLNRAIRQGSIGAAAADRLATAIGLHPVEIWPDWYTLEEEAS